MNRLRSLTPNACVAAAIGLIMVCAFIAPRLVYRTSHDGGFVEGGQKINLSRWTRISANRNGGALPAINRPDNDPPTHFESWINAGQWIRFDHVPVTRRSRFTAEVRVHPEWPRDRATPVSFNVIARAKGQPELVAHVVPEVSVQTEWTRLELDLAPLAGQEVRIQLAPSADQDVWTLMRDPRIELSPAKQEP